MTWIATAITFAKRIPWQLYGIAVVLALGWLWGNHRYNAGEEAERTRWEAKVIELERKLRQAERDAQAEYDKGRDTRQAQSTDLRNRAREAEHANPVEAGRSCGPVTTNVLDGLRSQAAGN